MNFTATASPIQGRTDTLSNISKHLNLDEQNVETNTKEFVCVRFDFAICVVLIGIFCVLGITGNVTSWVVLWKHKTETATMFLLQTLAVSDTILLLASLLIYVLPTLYPYVSTLRRFDDVYQISQTYIWPLSLMAHTTTVWVTVLVTLNRYYAVCRLTAPLRSYVLKATKLQVVGVVAFSIIYNIPRFFEHQPLWMVPRHINASDGTSNVTYDPVNLGDSRIYQIVYSNIMYYPVMYIAPLCILAYLNVKLIRALNVIHTRKEALTGHKVKDDNITVVIIVIVIVFILCQTPALVNQIFWATVSKFDRQCGHFHFYYTRISDALVVLNSSTNFLIYCLFGKTFRKVFKETLSCKSNMRRRSKSDPSAQPLTELHNAA